MSFDPFLILSAFVFEGIEATDISSLLEQFLEYEKGICIVYIHCNTYHKVLLKSSGCCAM